MNTTRAERARERQVEAQMNCPHDGHIKKLVYGGGRCGKCCKIFSKKEYEQIQSKRGQAGDSVRL